ncbi:MAG: hypothetical protein ABFD46_02720 [Armatimonadota bacterium]
MNGYWYEREDIREKLVLFGRAIQGPGPYEVVIEPDQDKCHSACCSFESKRITVNPTIFNVSPKEQYLLTKAALVHEAGHRRYTTPTPLPSIISEIFNILEDERVENRMWEEFIGLRWLIKRLAARFYEEAEPVNKASDMPHAVVSYFLQLRWAKRIGKPVKGGLSSRNAALWEKIEPLVYESWQAESSESVTRNTAKIAEILSFNEIIISNRNNSNRNGGV